MSELPAEALYDLRTPTELALSPDGDRLALVVDEFDPTEETRRSSLLVVPTDASERPHRLTRASSASSPAWSPDGSKLAFLAAREPDTELRVGREDEAVGNGEDEGDADGDDEPKTQLWAFDLARGGDARQLTDREEGVREFAWGPEGDRLVISARDPTEEEREYIERREAGGPVETERLQHKADGVGWLDTVRSYLFVIEYGSREETRLDEAYGAGAMEPLSGLQPAWAPGERIAFVTNREGEPDDSYAMDVCTIEPDGSDLRERTDGSLMASAPTWSPDGERLAFVAGQPDNWYVPSEVFVTDGEVRSLSASLDRTVARDAEPHWLDSETVLARIANEGNTRLARLPLDDDAEWTLDAQGEGRSLAGCSVASETVALLVNEPGTGFDPYALDAAALDGGEKPFTRLADLNAGFERADAFPEMTRIDVESEGETVEALVYYPEEFDPEAPVARPLLVAIHGGPMSYDEPVRGFDFAYWTSRGYLVMRPNYSGSSSYGREFCERLRGRWGTHEVTDVAACTEALVERGWAEEDGLFVTGFSYGGISTAFLVSQTDLYTAAAAEHGIYDLRSCFGTDDTHLWLENDFGLPWEERETYDGASSITDVDRIETPLLVTAGGEDWRCPPSQAEQLYVSVKKRGVPAKLVVYPGEHHAVDDPDRAIHRYEELAAWFERFDPARN
ncbi:S9 family peptidase [Natronorarus salvus]|uniref:S9 family peptidase n=1 Tax=Natronorarus salvus TaxID=3117733 RepID=UPI002F26DB3C